MRGLLISALICYGLLQVSCSTALSRKSGTRLGSEAAINAQKSLLQSSDYVLMFEDDFSVNNIGTNGAQLWKPRVDERRFFVGKTGEFTSYNRAQNNSVDSGILSIAFTKDAGKYCGGGIVSKKAMGYGYYEARVKIYTGSYGLHQSFWSYSDAVELDGFEVDSKLASLSALYPGRHRWLPVHYYYQATSAEKQNFVYVPNTSYKSPGVDRDPDGVWGPDDRANAPWYVVGYEWLPDPVTGEAGRVNYYVDNVLRASYNVQYSGQPSGQDLKVFQPSQLYVTALPFDIYPLKEMVDPLIGAKMEVDYVRYYAKKLTNANLLGNSGFDYTRASARDQNIVSWTDYSLLNGSRMLYNGGDRNNAYVIFTDKNWMLSHFGTAAYSAVTRQTINCLPAGTYNLSFQYKCNPHVKVVGNTVKAVVLNAHNNSQLASLLIPVTSAQTTFSTLTIPNISVESGSTITVLFYSKANANEYVHFDNVKFFAN